MKKLGWFFIFLLTVTVINYPNPFNPKGGEIATFECISSGTPETTLYIYDMAARLIYQKAGVTNRATWDGYINDNELAGNGVYLYRLIDVTTKKSVAKGKVWVINR